MNLGYYCCILMSLAAMSRLSNGKYTIGALVYVRRSILPNYILFKLNCAPRKTTCESCINLSPSCSWCSAANYTGPRCFSGTPAVNCSSVENPTGSITGITSYLQANLSSLVQVSPSQVNVTVRPGVGTTFTLSVQPANNYPLDVYLLTDLSYSFIDDLMNLKSLGATIATSIQKISTNAQVGFGSFVDKKLAPYINILPALINDPCAPPYGPGGCVPPYSYKHTVSLTSNGSLFSSRLQAQIISGNQDVPEGGWDGFMQAVVCKQLIGWRNNARHLLVFSTDANFHHAGDGLLGGVIRPNPHQCLMNQSFSSDNVEYTLSETYDYPSLGDLREQLRINDIIPIFAVTSTVLSIYQNVATELASVGASTGALAGDSSNIIQLIQTAYNTVSQRIVFDPTLPNGVSLTFTPINCPQLESDGITCSGVTLTQGAINFTVSVQVTPEFCATYKGNPISVPVRVVGFGSVVINISPLCNCNCQNVQQSNSPSCTSNGTLICGICTCNPGRFGSSCQCDANGVQTGNTTTCPLGPNNNQCSGQSRGSCICGKCACNQYKDIRLGVTSTYFGSACECDNSLCDTANGQLCGGNAQGICQCGGCQCLGDFYGSACQCSNSLCVDPTDTNTSRTCNGRGVCSCNQCTGCKPPYTGQYCQSCQALDRTTCANLLCPPNLGCAKCALVNSTTCPASCPPTFLVNATTAGSISGVITECQYTDSNGCQDTYYAVQDNNGVLQSLYVRVDPACPTSLAPAQIATIIIVPLVALAVIGILILLALLLAFWLLNRAEVRRFEKELARAKYTKNQNPLYVPANQQTKNPIYEGEKAQ